MGLNILAYFIAGLVALIVAINLLFPTRPAPQRHKPQHRTIPPVTTKPKPSTKTIEDQINAALDKQLRADIIKDIVKDPTIKAAYDAGYRIVSYDPLIMELRE